MDEHDLKKMVDEGHSQRKIAETFDVSQATVRYWLKKYGFNTEQKHKCNCGEIDPSKFHPGRFSQCKKCRKEDQRHSHHRNKIKSVEYKGGKCQVCGYDRNTASMDFHHVDPTQKDPDWVKMRRWSWKKLQTEIDKCILVCKNCHSEIHHAKKLPKDALQSKIWKWMCQARLSKSQKLPTLEVTSPEGTHVGPLEVLKLDCDEAGGLVFVLRTELGSVMTITVEPTSDICIT